MKVLILSTNGALKDGITAWIVQQFRRLDRTGVSVVDVIAFPGTDEGVLDELRQAGLRVRVIPSRRKHPLRYLWALWRLIRASEYEVVHINGNSGTTAADLVIATLAGSKARILHSHNTSGLYPTVDKALRPIMLRLATHRIACGREAGEWLFGTREFMVIPNGRDFEEYAYSPAVRDRSRKVLGLGAEDFAIGHVGRFNAQKNHRFLIDAFAEAVSVRPALKLLLLGDGDLRTEVEEQVRQRNLEEQVIFVGQTSKVAAYLNALDLGVLPSLHEGFPGVVIEWQINGLQSHISDTVTDECAVTKLVEFLPADREIWAQAMVSAAALDRATSSREAQALLRSAGYEAQSGAAMLRSLYLSAVGN